MPLTQGSTTVNVIAVATAASTALPPLSSIRRPAFAACGELLQTTPWVAINGMRREP